MANHPYSEFYIPLSLLAATPLAGLGLPALTTWISPPFALVLAVLIFVMAGVLAYRAIKIKSVQGRGGKGGAATSTGDENQALGGDGGAANGGTGGDGGDATVKGIRSVAKGGRGGHG